MGLNEEDVEGIDFSTDLEAICGISLNGRSVITRVGGLLSKVEVFNTANDLIGEITVARIGGGDNRKNTIGIKKWLSAIDNSDLVKDFTVTITRTSNRISGYTLVNNL